MQPHHVLDQIANESYALSAAFRRHGEMLARRVGQTQARWQVLRAASTGLLSVPQIARLLGVTRQNVQRIADSLVTERLARFVVNRDHKNSPHLMLNERGLRMLEDLSDSAIGYRDELAGHLTGMNLVRTLAIFRDLSTALAKIDMQAKTNLHTVSKTGRDRSVVKIKSHHIQRARST